MRCLNHFKGKSLSRSRHLIVAALGLVLAACGRSGGDMEEQLKSLQATVEKQTAQLQVLQAAHESHRHVLDRLSEWEHVKFRIDDVRYEVVEKAFEPLIVGEAQLTLAGEAQPELIFVEWSVNVDYKGNSLTPATYIQRVEDGATTLKIVHPLPSHGIRKEDISIEVKPTGWYMAHVAQLAE